MNIIDSSFHPVKDFHTKKNYKEQYMIDEKGNIKRRVLLNIPDPRMREEIILKHYLKQYTRYFLKCHAGITILSRDDPWDFKIKINDGNPNNIEITSIADSEQIFRETKHEEIIEQIKDNPNISIRDLKNISKKISSDFKFPIIDVNAYKDDDIIDNPLFQAPMKIWLSMCDYKFKNIDDIIWQAINKKINKKNDEKENTILIIDNRTIHCEINDIMSFVSQYCEALDKLPFMEIWLYTGYYSDYECNDCEFDIIPMKLTETDYKLYCAYPKH